MTHREQCMAGGVHGQRTAAGRPPTRGATPETAVKLPQGLPARKAQKGARHGGPGQNLKESAATPRHAPMTIDDALSR
jgi:hypothetical protein